MGDSAQHPPRFSTGIDHRVDEERSPVTRRERQQQQIAIEISRGHFARVLVIAREHLAEFPDDIDVQLAVALAARATGEAASDV